MNGRKHLRTARFVAVGALVIAGISVSAAPTLADTPFGHSGSYGRHQLVDTEEYPGVNCRYDARFVLNGVTARAPIVFARDRTTGRDRQLVSWRIRVQRAGNSSSTWTTLFSGPVQRAYAYDDVNAAFTSSTVSFSANSSFRYRILVAMFWYAPGTTTVQGTATHVDDWYRLPAAPSYGPGGACSGAVF